MSKRLVEDCTRLEVGMIVGQARRDILERRPDVSHEVLAGVLRAYLQQGMSVTIGDMSYPLTFTDTQLPTGGTRWWFRCPECGRRVRELYLTPDSDTLACRRCHDLAYRSQMERLSEPERLAKMARMMDKLEGD